MAQDTPNVGIGVIIENSEGKILVGKRKGSFAPFYSIPGGKLGIGETFENAAIREIKEESNLIIKNPKVIAVVNQLETFKNEGIHYIAVVLHTKYFSGKLTLMEPEKCEEWLWCDPNKLPQPHFDGSTIGVQCYLEKVFYIELPNN